MKHTGWLEAKSSDKRRDTSQATRGFIRSHHNWCTKRSQRRRQ